jgi:hypothetical protein
MINWLWHTNIDFDIGCFYLKFQRNIRLNLIHKAKKTVKTTFIYDPFKHFKGILLHIVNTIQKLMSTP